MARTHRYSKKQIQAAISGCNGLVTVVANRLHCDWHTARENIDRFPDLVRLFEDEKEIVLDCAEQNIHNAIKNKDMVTTRWFLATAGKKRGFSYMPIHAEDDAPAEDTEIRIILDDSEQ